MSFIHSLLHPLLNYNIVLLFTDSKHFISSLLLIILSPTSKFYFHTSPWFLSIFMIIIMIKIISLKQESFPNHTQTCWHESNCFRQTVHCDRMNDELWYGHRGNLGPVQSQLNLLDICYIWSCSDNLAVLRSDSGMGVDVVLESRNCLEHTWADTALVWSLLWMCLQMPGQEVTLGTGIVTVVAHQMCSTPGTRRANRRRVHIGILQRHTQTITLLTLKFTEIYIFVHFIYKSSSPYCCHQHQWNNVC